MLGVIMPEEYDLGVIAHTLSSPFNCDFLGEPVTFCSNIVAKQIFCFLLQYEENNA